MNEKPRSATDVKHRRLVRRDWGCARRLGTEIQVVRTYGFPLATFRHLVACGRLPRPLPEFGLYDMKAIDAALDRMSGLGGPANALDRWREGRDADVR